MKERHGDRSAYRGKTKQVYDDYNLLSTGWLVKAGGEGVRDRAERECHPLPGFGETVGGAGPWKPKAAERVGGRQRGDVFYS
ncbi:MAG: hypothetical protein JXD19_06150 [Deltaproteobacteria bacterium]|nr:hypothetical protein [Deltaproteobacteria bacterium]